jgi:hypothetical protein
MLFVLVVVGLAASAAVSFLTGLWNLGLALLGIALFPVAILVDRTNKRWLREVNEKAGLTPEGEYVEKTPEELWQEARQKYGGR